VGNSRHAVFGAGESDQIGQSDSAFFGMIGDPGQNVKRENVSMHNVSINNESDTSSIILVVEDVDETRDGIEKLLKADGYRVTLARDQKDAIESAQRQPPNLILVSVAGLPHEVVITARNIRERGGLEDNVPVVVFCVAEIDEGAEVAIGKNVYITRPDNFEQLRTLLARLLNEIPIAA
jgi:CheY-like chemotaxis protein